MRKRYLYALLFAVPGFLIAGTVTLLVLGASVGFLWLFVFGDNPWPPASEKNLSIVLVTTFLLLWVATLILGYLIGRRLENDSTLNRSHILLAGTVTGLLILFILLQQWSLGNLGPKSVSVLCSDYCSAQGYAGSGLPPETSGNRTCSCYDASGNEVRNIPLDSISK